MAENVLSGVDADRSSRAQLRRVLDEYFNETELRNLCFDIGIDYEGLSSGGKADKARELIAHCERHVRVDELERRCRKLRPNAPWTDRPQLPAITLPRRAELPHQPYFFGREAELARIADALDPESTGWGVLIDGAGGIGKTALAIRAGHRAPDQVFSTKIFLSAKVRELTPHGEQKLEDFQLPNYMALLAELARELGEDEIAEGNPNERAKEVRRTLESRQALIIFDNLETLDEQERERLFQFLRRLPRSCKAIVTSRRRTDVAAEIIRLDRLTPEAAHALIAKLAERRPVLARASQDEWNLLYETAGGNPLLIEWLAGQLGRPGSRCRTVADACAFIQTALPGNDPLEYIFGDLLDTFTEGETLVLAALSHFTQPAKSKWIAEMTNLPLSAAQTALEDMTDRALLTADAQNQTFFLSPLAAVFLRRKRIEAVAQTGNRLTDRVLMLVIENGWYKFDRFPVLDAEWPAIAAALPLFLQGDNARLQHLCQALHTFLNYSGRWDERLALNQQAEQRASAANDAEYAGWRAYNAGMVYFRRGQALELLACARRAEAHWARGNTREKAYALRLRGLGHQLQKDYVAALDAFREALAIHGTPEESAGAAVLLHGLAEVEHLSGDYAAAERDYLEALRIARKVDDHHNIPTYSGSLAVLALDRQDWPGAEALAQEALSLAEAVRRHELIALDCHYIAQALARQGRPQEGLLYAQRAVEILTKLRHRDLEKAQAVLKECEEAATDGIG